MARPRIVMVNNPIHPIPPAHGAAVEWWMYQVAQRLQGYEPHICCIGAGAQPDEETRGSLAFHRIRIGRAYRRLFQKITRFDPWPYARRVARRIAALRPTIVQVHNAPALAAQLHALDRGGARYMLHMHNAMPLVSTNPAIRLLVNSHYLKNWYTAQHPTLSIDVVTNGVDIRAFHPRWVREPAVEQLKIKLGLAPERKVILFVGRISPEKGTLDLVRAFKALLERRRDVVLVIVGELRSEGKPEDQRADYGRAVRAACDELGEHCRLAGVIDPAVIGDYYALGDLLVVPSRFEEPFGMVAIEGMAAGVPVLAVRKGGLPEFVRHGETGFLIDDAENPDAFAAQIDMLLGQRELLERVRRQARAYVEAHHDWSTVATQLEHRFDSILNKRA